MSADEDTELRDLVAQSLAGNGVLGKIRAELRANVFLALEEQESVQNQTPFLNPVLKHFISTKEGQIVTGLVREFMEFFNLEFSIAVFEPESNYKNGSYEGRNALARELGITESESTMGLPLLSEIVKRTSGDNVRYSNSQVSSVQESGVEIKKKLETQYSKLSASLGINSSNHSKKEHEGSSVGDGDPFFDDPVPPNEKSNNSKRCQNSIKDRHTFVNPTSGEMTSLPSLTANDEEYEDDFDSSNITPRGATPRTAQSDVQSDGDLKSVEEEIDEDIEEELSIAEDLLKSDASGVDDLTTDRTVSPTEQSSAFDYIEDVMVP